MHSDSRGILCDMQRLKIRIGSFIDDKKIDLIEDSTFTLDSHFCWPCGTDSYYFSRNGREVIEAYEKRVITRITIQTLGRA